MAAGDTQHHDIAFPDIDEDGDTREVTYEVDLLLAEATAWAPAGYELAFGQLTGRLIYFLQTTQSAKTFFQYRQQPSFI